MASVKKGDRVEIARGKQGVGSVGTVFWTGPDRFNEGVQRLGVRADNGETLWVSEKDVEPASNKPAPPPVDPPNKGDRVRWRNRGDEGEGNIFWVGKNKSGPGFRVGVRLDDQEDPLWLDARQVEVIEAPPRATSALPGGNRAPVDDDEEVAFFADGATTAGPAFLDEDVPFDESHAWTPEGDESGF